jgi:3-phenylpropionate/cinnamic acid dioxygenase small subunit
MNERQEIAMSEALLQELLDREAIKETKARYCRFFDAQDFEGFRSVFADDCTYQILDYDPVVGADAFVASGRANVTEKPTRTAHHIHNPEITFVSPTEARATFVLADYVEWPSLETGERVGFKGFGRYDETFKKIDGEWKIATWRLSYTRMDPVGPDPLPTEIPGLPMEWANVVVRQTATESLDSPRSSGRWIRRPTS